MKGITTARRRGSPVAMLALLLGAWVAGRAALWESPFPIPDIPSADALFADSALSDQDPERKALGETAYTSADNRDRPITRLAMAGLSGRLSPPTSNAIWRGYSALNDRSPISIGHQMLMAAAFDVDWHSGGLGGSFGPSRQGRGYLAGKTNATPPFAAQPGPERSGETDRWSLDVFAFYRAGSGSLSPSQGRVPVYGANQVAANLQYRIDPFSRRDPRAYLRAYQALVSDGETELAAGLSARPVGRVPLRLAGEVRATRSPFGTDIRPAGYAVTELGPQSMPLRFSLETYAAAGYVGGKADTYFVDGQASLSREVLRLEGPGDQPMRLSVGGGAWGGAQEDASRLDIGPTVRLDLSVGEVPARVSVDWRERVAGDAAPDSGVAATVSTRF